VSDSIVENPPWRLKHGWKIQMNGGEPAGGNAAGAVSWVPQGVVAITSWLGGCGEGACAAEGAGALLASFAEAAPKYGIFAGTYGQAVRLHLERPVHVTVAGRKGDARARALFEAAVRAFPPHKAVVWVEPGAEPPAGFPESARDFARGYPREKLPAACVCRGTHCNIPTSDPAALIRQVQAAPERPAN